MKDETSILPISGVLTRLDQKIIVTLLLSISLTVLTGWTLDIEAMKRIFPSFIAMNPLSAVCFMLGAIALATSTRRGEIASLLFVNASAVSTLIGLMILGQYLGFWTTSIDAVLFESKLVSQLDQIPNRMAPNTACCFLLCGVALLLVRTQKSFLSLVAQLLAILVLLHSSFAILGYMFQLRPLYGIVAFIPMALLTAIAFAALSTGVLIASTNGLKKLITGSVSWKIYGGIICLVFFSTAFVTLFINRKLEENLLDFTEEKLFATAYLFDKRELFDTATTSSTKAALVDFYARTGIRITLFSADGKVIVDSNGVEDFNASHLNRPEIVAALANEYGMSSRKSTFGKMEMMYVAVALHVDNKIIGFSRAALATDKINDKLGVMRFVVFQGAFYSLLVALIGGYWFARRLTTPLEKMTDLMKDFQAGNYDQSLTIKSQDEFGRLAETFNKLTVELQTKIHDLTEARVTAEGANRAKSSFLATMSHEIRTPLNGVVGMTELLSKTPLDEKQQHYLHLLKHSAELLTQLLNNVLDFSKIEAGKLEIEEREFDLPQTLEAIVEMMAPRIGKKEIDMLLSIDSKCPSIVIGDSFRLQQIFTNLIANAMKFTERGEIAIRAKQISCDEEHAIIRFSIRDTGMGIPRDKIARLFSPFSQAEASTAVTHGGTGLGLAVCKELVTLFNGEIGVESTSGVGSEFWFTVQFKLSRNAERKRTARDEQLSKLKILVVEPNVRQRQVLCAQLAEWGVDAMSISSAEEVEKTLIEAKEAKKAIDVVLCASEVLGKDNSLSPSWSKTSPSSKFIMLLTAENEIVEQSVRAQGFHESLRRPILPSRLLDLLMNVASKEGYLVPKKSKASAEPVVPTNKRVLIAEDNPANQVVTSEILKSAGYQCDIVETGEKAVDAVLERHYDVIVMDCQMPILDGLEATRRIRAREIELEAAGKHVPRIPIIALTARAMQDDREQCFASGMDDYVPKPLDPTRFLEAVHTAVSGGHAVEHHEGNGQNGSQPITTSREVLNLVLLRERFPNPEIIASVLNKFEKQVQESITFLDSSFDTSSSRELHHMAHNLSGIAGLVGAEEIGATAAIISELSRDAHQVPKSLCNRLHDELERCDVLLHKELAQMK